MKDRLTQVSLAWQRYIILRLRLNFGTFLTLYFTKGLMSENNWKLIILTINSMFGDVLLLRISCRAKEYNFQKPDIVRRVLKHKSVNEATFYPGRWICLIAQYSRPSKNPYPVQTSCKKKAFTIYISRKYLQSQFVKVCYLPMKRSIMDFNKLLTSCFKATFHVWINSTETKQMDRCMYVSINLTYKNHCINYIHIPRSIPLTRWILGWTVSTLRFDKRNIDDCYVYNPIRKCYRKWNRFQKWLMSY